MTQTDFLKTIYYYVDKGSILYAIKFIKDTTDIGLKRSKEILDSYRHHNKNILLQLTDPERRNLKRSTRKLPLGMLISNFDKQKLINRINNSISYKGTPESELEYWLNDVKY